jgi:hypothetical protein
VAGIRGSPPPLFFPAKRAETTAGCRHRVSPHCRGCRGRRPRRVSTGRRGERAALVSILAQCGALDEPVGHSALPDGWPRRAACGCVSWARSES